MRTVILTEAMQSKMRNVILKAIWVEACPIELDRLNDLLEVVEAMRVGDPIGSWETVDAVMRLVG